MSRIYTIEICEFEPVHPWEDILTKIYCKISSLYHTTLNTILVKLVFGRDVLFDIFFTPYWKARREKNDRKTYQK